MHLRRIVFTRRPLAAIAIGVAGAAALISCSGPQPLSLAIRPADESAFLALVKTAPTPREAFLRQRAEAQGITVEEAERRDSQLTRNPFNARRDQEAVSRGAVIYRHECLVCHGEHADGRGPAMPAPTSAMNFHRFGNRFAVTIHHGAPSKWFRIISEGVTADVRTPDGETVAVVMPPFNERLSREQMWLAVTYLQSLDRDLPATDDAENHS